MNDSTQEPSVSLVEEILKGFIEKDGVGRDHFLQFLVGVLNRDASAAMGVTLTVGGSQISGELIGGAAYFEELSSVFAKAFGNGDEAATTRLKQTMNKFGDVYRSDVSEADAESNADRPPPVYVHMRNAQQFAPGGLPIPGNGCLWRGKLSAVDGFSLGKLSVDK
ncbi:gas vesicle protein [Stenotrophomonas forensis]|uniref:gas vesicle protein n=1 Tax=Stenotrophomonas forensis TaxID=2871169 RepID=UPI0039C75061